MESQSLKITKLLKQFDGARPFTLGPLEFQWNSGDSIAVLGANGAGKSTLFQLLTGNLSPSEGTILLGDQRVTVESSEQKRSFGYLPQALDLPRWATAQEILTIAAALYQLPAAATSVKTAMEIWDIASFAQLPLAACSYGMQKRVGLALAFLHTPHILIIDEPFSGLDLFHIRALEEQLQLRRKSTGITVLSTHVAPYAARFCERAFMISKGSLRELERWTTASVTAREELVEQTFFRPSSH